ncbi:MAG: hypothetical protein DMD87_10925 [Candidatus Rokuibacteriota bacterium]|nr:MAG: hypothetical protein DMD87_10925 [Candidatus Rokubacteria bacterium]
MSWWAARHRASGAPHGRDHAAGAKSASGRDRPAPVARRPAGLGDASVPARERCPHPDRGDRAAGGRAERCRRDRRLLSSGRAQRGRRGLSPAARLQEREEPPRRAGLLGPDRRSLDAPLLVGAPLTLQRAGAAVWCTLDRPPLNLFEPTLIRAVRDSFAELAADRATRVAVIVGSGRAFTAGMDVRVLRDLDTGRARDLITTLHDAIAAVHRAPFPVIAAVHGPCLGAGFELALACDLRVAAASASFGLPEVRVGVPSVIQAALLPPMIGPGRAAEMLLTGTPVTAAQALDWGLVNRVVPDERLRAAAEEVVAAILASGPEAIRLQKELIVRWRETDLTTAVRYGINAFATAYATVEPREGMNAYLEKRPPNFER